MKYLLIFLISIFVFNISSANTDIENINKQLDSIKNLYDTGVLDQDAYNNAKEKLETQKKTLQNSSNNKNNSETSVALEKQIKVLDNLLKDNLISQDEYNQSKKFLEDKDKQGKNVNLNEISNTNLKYQLNVKRVPGRKSWEKAEIIYDDFKFIAYRPGGIRLIRISDNKKLLQITDNFKIKYFNDGENIVEIKKNVYEVKTAKNPDELVKNIERDVGKSLSDVGDLLKNPIDKLFNKNKKKDIWDKEAHKLEVFIDGQKLLQIEGRYVDKHKAYFYQVLTPKYEPFHFYIKLRAKSAIALNMEYFNARIDKALRKAKKRLSIEHNITEAEIDRIIEQQIGRETNKAVEKAMEKAISESVEEAIAETVGEVLSATLVNAIEQETGEAIDQAIEDELAAAIDAEIAYAVSIGIDEAAVTAGWEAYFEVLAQGGTIEQASAAAYEACGSACDNY